MGPGLKSLADYLSAAMDWLCRQKTTTTIFPTVFLLLGSVAIFAQAPSAAGARMSFSGYAVVNVHDLAEREKQYPTASQPQAPAMPPMEHKNLAVPPEAVTNYLMDRTLMGRPRLNTDGAHSSSASAGESAQSLSPAPFSPAARFPFAGTSDNGLRIPPGPSGAVNQNYLVETVNGTFSVFNRAGTPVKSVFMDTFWASVGGVSTVVNARVTYDPYNNRWIMAAEANGNTANSAVLIGVSQTSDPTANWYLFKVNSDPNSWANFPTLGFNANWIAVSMNMYQVGCSSNCFQQENVYVFNKAQLYAGTLGTVTKFSDTSGAATYMAAVTLDNSATTPLYLLQKWNENSGGTGYLRLGAITGTPSSPSMNLQVNFVGLPPWTFSGGVANGGFAPQNLTSTRIDTLDDRMASLTYRDGALWGAQTVFLPAGSATHSSVLWYGFDPTNISNGFYDFIDDASGTEFRAYPSIAVNKFDDALIGYSIFTASRYATAAYSFSSHRDQAFVETEQVLQNGLGPYVKFGVPNTGINYWGYYSGTAVDPTNDTDLWTLQEYASNNVGSTGDFGRWGTFWGMVQIANTKFNASSTPSPVTAGTAFSFNVAAADNSNFAVTGYGGTVHFTSSDATAVLPPDYTFSETDQGFHVFTGVILHKAGTPSITITDTTTAVASTVNVTVNPAAMSTFLLALPASTTAGNSFSLTATASDPYNNTIANYIGTVKFSSNDPAATLPGNYTFTGGDAGVHTFAGVILRTAGTRSITATDNATSSIAGSNTINVSPAALNHLGVAAPPTATPNYAFNFTVAAQDQFNNTVPSYLGTVAITPTGVAANVAPTPYTFIAGDQGVHTFSSTVTGAAPATLTLTANDAGNAVSGNTNVSVVSDAPLTARGRRLRFRVGLPLTLAVASVTDSDTAETGSHLSAIINWGDGTPTSAGTFVLQGAGTGVFVITGTHRYLGRGAFSISVQINDSGGFQTNAVSKAVMGPKPSSF